MSEEQILDNISIQKTFAHYGVKDLAQAKRAIQGLYKGQTENLTADKIILDLVSLFNNI